MPGGRSADECTVEEADDNFSLCTDGSSPRYQPEGQELAAGPASSSPGPKVKYRKSLSWRSKSTFMATSRRCSAASSPPSPRSTCSRSLLSMTTKRCRLLDLVTTDAVQMNDYTFIKEADGETCSASFVDFIYFKDTPYPAFRILTNMEASG
ncbi:hypothetical protein CTA1_6477 [Colletotrichum tanaceti]|uniref:Uncharacterized protein n=1 Tax=Colletotrichum tanaceti TaxID=1306861 RepID=A0A4U6XS42_9PEZI|nr:hypothetical protein CTA1_6477 [Colletotrichum tanaceti]